MSTVHVEVEFLLVTALVINVCMDPASKSNSIRKVNKLTPEEWSTRASLETGTRDNHEDTDTAASDAMDLVFDEADLFCAMNQYTSEGITKRELTLE